MGKAMSLMGKRVVKPLREYNIEARAHKVISRDKPKPAPSHRSNIEISNEVKKAAENLQKHKDEQLSKRLTEVFVTSKDSDEPHPNKRILPESRQQIEDPEYGYHEPSSIPYGKVTIRKAIHFINSHQDDAKKWPAKEIARSHKLDVSVTENVLKYYSVFSVLSPSDKNTVKERQFLVNLRIPSSVFPADFPLNTLEAPKDKSEDGKINLEMDVAKP